MENKIKERLGNRVVNWEKKNERRYYIEIKKEDVEEVTQILFKELGLRFSIASGIDTIDNFEILYHFSADNEDKFFSLRVKISKEKPEIHSISKIITAAKWIEREIWELLGINFIGHPGLERLILTEDWPKGVCPLRKDFTNEQRPEKA
ncbi:NADH-quinone oxidoreductase subunit C [candidate division WOR-3 bacterium]|nr:NADH-quinone oxidoreductase subunit C [candidate division WOR-3 bacterium]